MTTTMPLRASRLPTIYLFIYMYTLFCVEIVNKNKNGGKKNPWKIQFGKSEGNALCVPFWPKKKCQPDDDCECLYFIRWKWKCFQTKENSIVARCCQNSPPTCFFCLHCLFAVRLFISKVTYFHFIELEHSHLWISSLCMCLLANWCFTFCFWRFVSHRNVQKKNFINVKMKSYFMTLSQFGAFCFWRTGRHSHSYFLETWWI